MSAPTRGERNNNPGNIDFNPANDWQGQLGIETSGRPARFARFDSPENGIRALGKLLRTYQNKHGLNTVAKIIGRWAPTNENDTAAYVGSVAAKLGVGPTSAINVNSFEVLRPLVEAIIRHENGRVNYAPATIDEGVRRALK